MLAKAWGPYPLRHEGTYFSFDDVWLEPGAFRPEGPAFWFGGQGMHPPLVRRLARYGQGLNPFGSLTDADLAMLADGMRAAGRDLSELELVGGIRGTFHGPDDLADLDQALESLPRQLAQGYTTICFKPAMFIDDVADMGGVLRRPRRQDRRHRRRVQPLSQVSAPAATRPQVRIACHWWCGCFPVREATDTASDVAS